MNEIEAKRQREKQLVKQMIELYCHGVHHVPKGQLCADCQALLTYAEAKADRCPRMADKTFCSQCPHPCYRPEQREAIRQVMRYAGPRLLLHHPGTVLSHLYYRLRQKATRN